MKIGFLSTRLAGTDGVSLEVEKWSNVLRRMGHSLSFCAGELGGYAGGGVLIPRLHFAHPEILALNELAFNPRAAIHPFALEDQIYALAAELRPLVQEWIQGEQLDWLVVENALSIPMNLPLGVCLTGLIRDLHIPTLAHHHDFYWERERFHRSLAFDLLDAVFPPDLPSIQHITINSIAQAHLQARRSLESTVIPNVHDFSVPAPGRDPYNQDLPAALGANHGEPFILQPTRVIPRKGIELAIELVGRLDLPSPCLTITHPASDEGLDYWNWLQHEAAQMDVRLNLVAGRIAPQREQRDGQKVYSLWDAYPFAHLVTYPSLYEGFGNALLELVYFRRPAVVNRYPVYNADLRPLGFQFIELNGYVDVDSVAAAKEWLADPRQVQPVVDANFAIAREHFSLDVLERKLREIIR